MRVCQRGLHDLSDPDSRVAGYKGCKECRNDYQRRLRRGLPPLPPPDAVVQWHGKAHGRYVLPPDQMAYLRSIAACRSCSAEPVDDKDGQVRIHHARGCQGVIDRVDAE